MPYTVYKTDGSILTDVLDSSIDKTTTDLTLIGKNTSNYGEYFNQNFVKLLENFANADAPKAPLKGQIWYDSGQEKLKYYDGEIFRELNRPTVSTIEPVLSPGDFWINNQTRQLYFNDGVSNRLAGPIYTAQQGISGNEVATVVDINGTSHVIVKFKIGDRLVGVYAKERFTPNYNLGTGKILASEGISGQLIIGFNPSNLGIDQNGNPINFKLNVTVKSAENLVDAFGNPVNVDEFVRTVGITPIDGRISLTGNNPNNSLDPVAIPLILGYSSNLSFEINQITQNEPNPVVKVKANVDGQDLSIVTKNGIEKDAIYLDSSEDKIGIFNNNPLEKLDVNGNINIRGNLKTNNSTINIINETASVINFGGAATAVNIGSISGNTTVNNNLIVDYDVKINGGDLRSGTQAFNLLNESTETINFGSEATTINIGSTANGSTVNFRKDITVAGLLNITGEFLVDNVLITENNIIAITPNTDLNIKSIDSNINLQSTTIGEQNLILQKRLVFDGFGIISVPQGFSRDFELLNEWAGTILVGGDATRIDLGSDTGFTNIRNNLQVDGNITVGDFQNSPANIDSNGDVINLFSTRAQTINLGDRATTVNVLYEPQLPGNPNPNLGKYLNIYAEDTYFDGDITVRGGDVKAPNGVTIATVFNSVSGRITIGTNAAVIEAGGPGTILRVGRSLKVGSVAGEIELVSDVSSGSITKGELNVGETTAFFDILPDFVQELKIGASSVRTEIGKGNVLETDNTLYQPSINSGLNGASQVPVIIARNNLLIRNKLLMPTLDPTVGAGGAGVIYKNTSQELEASIYVRLVGNSLAVSGDIILAGRLVGTDQFGTANIPTARIDDLELTGNLTTNQTTLELFSSNVTTFNLGSNTSNATINLGNSTSTVLIPGIIKEKWTTVTTLRNAVAGDNLLIDTVTLNVNVIINLPATPSIGDKIRFLDKNGISVAKQLFITRNGNKINGLDADLNIQTPGRGFALIWTGATRGWCYENA